MNITWPSCLIGPGNLSESLETWLPGLTSGPSLPQHIQHQLLRLPGNSAQQRHSVAAAGTTASVFSSEARPGLPLCICVKLMIVYCLKVQLRNVSYCDAHLSFKDLFSYGKYE